MKTTCVIGDVAFEVEWVSIIHRKYDLLPRRLCRATTMLSLFDAINIHDVTTETGIRVSWGSLSKRWRFAFWLEPTCLLPLFLVNNLNLLSESKLIPSGPYNKVQIYSNLFQACFSYSTNLCLRFFGLQKKVMVTPVNEAEK